MRSPVFASITIADGAPIAGGRAPADVTGPARPSSAAKTARESDAPRGLRAALPDLDLLARHERELVEVRVQLLQLVHRDPHLLRDRAERVAALHDVDPLRQLV